MNIATEQTPEQIKAEADYERALSKIKAAKPGSDGAESEYRQAFDRLVALGLRSPLRAKYRGRV